MNNRAGISEGHQNLSLATDAGSFLLRGGIVETKRCCRCKQDVDILLFGIDKSRNDGMAPRCKPCRKIIAQEKTEVSKKYYNLHRDELAEKRLENIDARREYDKRYRQENKAKIALYHKKRRFNNPKKEYAIRSINNAIKLGKMVKPQVCSFCGEVKKLDGHHEDYDKPLEVIWLCRRCHMAVHAELEQTRSLCK